MPSTSLGGLNCSFESNSATCQVGLFNNIPNYLRNNNLYNKKSSIRGTQTFVFNSKLRKVKQTEIIAPGIILEYKKLF